MNPRAEADKLRALADAARDRGAFALANVYGELARLIESCEPETVLEALRSGELAVARRRC